MDPAQIGASHLEEANLISAKNQEAKVIRLVPVFT